MCCNSLSDMKGEDYRTVEFTLIFSLNTHVNGILLQNRTKLEHRQIFEWKRMNSVLAF